jgi:phenylalanyl-tRNA synthetase beta chain
MRVPLSWIRDFNDCELPAEEIAKILTRAGLEVEAIERIGVYSRQVLAAEVLAVEEVPGARELRAVEVALGGERRATAVTGAPNVAAGAVGRKVPAALPGARLIDAKAERFAVVEVAARELRGIASGAVLCSQKELGIADDHSGVLFLDDRAAPGAPVAEILRPPRDIDADVVLELAILPNYGRCLSIVGVAREIAALTRTSFRLSLDARYLPLDPKAFDVSIEDPELAPRYSGYVLEGVEVTRSPAWMERRLVLAGLQPINNLVDVTNYVMLELGQPMHAFDLDKLPARNIRVRRARPGETIHTLDQSFEGGAGGGRPPPRELDPSVLLITSGDKPVAVAGVIGGLESEISPDTRNVLLESANFDFIAIRKAMSKLKVVTDSSTRFSRQVDPSLTVVAIQRAARLLEETLARELGGAIADCYPRPVDRRTLTVRTRDIHRALGVALRDQEISGALERLGFTVEAAGAGEITVDVPAFRPDVAQAADLAEEVIRVLGFDRLPNRRLHEPLPRQTCNASWKLRRLLRSALVGSNLHEVLNYSLTTPEAESRLRAAEAGARESPPYATIINPSSTERRALRRSVLASLLENAARNHRSRQRIALFEIGPVFLPEAGDGKLPAEVNRLGIVLSGPVIEPSWADPKPRAFGFHDLKGIVESLLAKLHASDAAFAPVADSRFHPGAAAELRIGGEPCGVLGQVHPAVADAYDLDGRAVFAADLELERLTAAASSVYSFRPIPRFPPVLQDLALVVDESVPAERVAAAIREAAGPLLTDVRLFDLYRGEQVGAGKKSLAFQLTYCSSERSLEEREVNAIREAMLGPLAEKLGAKIR